MCRRRGVGWGGGEGTGIGVAFEHFLCPISGDFDHNFYPKLCFCYPDKGIFTTSELFSSPKSREFDKKKRNNSNAAPMHVPSSPSKQ